MMTMTAITRVSFLWPIRPCAIVRRVGRRRPARRGGQLSVRRLDAARVHVDGQGILGAMSRCRRIPSRSSPSLVLCSPLALGGYAVVRARVGGERRRPGAGRRAGREPAPLARAPPRPEYERWLVGKVDGAGRRAQAARPPDAPVKIRLGVRNVNGYPTLRAGRHRARGRTAPRGTASGSPMRPTAAAAGSGRVTSPSTRPRRRSSSTSPSASSASTGGASSRASTPSPSAGPGLETPTGFFFINQKLKPAAPGRGVRRARHRHQRLPAQALGLGAGRPGGHPRHQPAVRSSARRSVTAACACTTRTSSR